MQKNNSNIGDFDSVINSSYGEPVTPEREEFRREAYAYCVYMTMPAKENIIQQGLEAYSSIRKKAMTGELPDLTLDEINEEIRLYREENSSTLGL
ncbi:MAG: hypothetical protein II455_06675 [Paludibacteraceae bacterium]|nr:hypothetical protein [Paludibacteraceae bacterium]